MVVVVTLWSVVTLGRGGSGLAGLRPTGGGTDGFLLVIRGGACFSVVVVVVETSRSNEWWINNDEMLVSTHYNILLQVNKFKYLNTSVWKKLSIYEIKGIICAKISKI